MTSEPLPLPTPGRSAAPTVAYGPGSVHRLPGILTDLGAARVLLLTGRRSFADSGAADILPDLEARATVERWSDFSPNTDSADLATGLDLYRRFSPDVVVGIGGGSVLDMAKLVAGYHDVDSDEVVDAVEAGRTADDRAARLVLVPTTSGSGAEATHFAVVYVGEAKHSIAGPAMRADAIVLDPALTLSGSAYQRATSGIDAVTQAIESRWATGATPASHRFARRALELLLPAIEGFTHRGDERAARAMAIGSHLAGRAIDISKTTAAHALSYSLTKRHGISHGHAVALTLGAFLQIHADAGAEDLQADPAAHAAAMGDVLAALDAADGDQARQRFTALLARLGLETRLSDLGIHDEAELRRLADAVNVERLSNNPVTLTPEGLVWLLRSVR